MKAIVIDDYGGVDQLRLREMPEPRPQIRWGACACAGRGR
jgi:hypothetical protein